MKNGSNNDKPYTFMLCHLISVLFLDRSNAQKTIYLDHSFLISSY